MDKPPHPASIPELVARYEALVDSGQGIFFDEAAFDALIHHYELEAQFDRALEVVDLALTHFSFSIDFHLRKASVLLNQDRVEEAMDTLDTAAALAPGEAEVALLRAEVLIGLGQYDTASALLDSMKDGADPELLSHILTVESLVYEVQGLFESMYHTLDAALREDPENREAIEHIWVAIESCKKYREGIDLFERLLDHNAYNALAWFYLGHIRAYFVEYDEAIACYEYAYLSEPRFEAAYRECGDLCFDNKLYQKALGIYEEALESFEPDGDLLMRMGQCHQAQGRSRMARSYYLQVLHYDPLDDEVLFHIGLCHALEGGWVRAIRYYERALQIDESREEYHDALGFAYQQAGLPAEARRCYERAVAAAPEQGLYWAHYACFLLESGLGEEALVLLNEAEDIATGHELAFCRVVCLLQLGRRQEGLYRLGEALTEYAEQHHALFDLMPRLEQDGDITSMISAYCNH